MNVYFKHDVIFIKIILLDMCIDLIILEKDICIS